MTNVKVHYDGWLSIPAPVRRRLALKSGDNLDLELVDGDIVLRPENESSDSGEKEVEDITYNQPEGKAKTASTKVAGKPLREASRSKKTIIRSASAKRAGAGKTTQNSLSALPKGLQARGRRKAEA